MSYCPACGSEYPDAWKRCPTDEAELLASRNIGKYRVDGIIGAGGMGAVYKAFNPDTRATVAIKLMHAEASSVEASRARFQREAAAVSALRTRHLCSIYDFGSQPDGTMFLVMEYLVGHNLRPEIQKAATGGMPPQRINMVMDHSLRGLAAAHKAGIVHRDLKPENIYIADTEDGDVAKVLDFGIAQVQNTKEQSVLTKEGALMGTPAYMAPEQVGGNRGDIGPYTDVYAMGVIAYEMFSGAAPFEDESVTAILTKVLTRDFKPLRVVRPDLPPAVLDLVDCAMADHYDDRFADAGAMREAWSAAYRTFDPAVKNADVPPFRLTRDHAAVVVNTPAGAPDPMMATEYPDAGVSTGSGVTGGGGGGHHLGTAETFAASASHTANPISNPPTTLTPGGHAMTNPPQPAKKGAGLWIALALLVLGGGGAAAFMMTRGGDDEHSGGTTARDAGTAPRPGVDGAVAQSTPDAAPAMPADMVAIEGGSYTMKGWPAEDVAGFYLDKTEMTVDGFNRAQQALGSTTAAAGAGDHPVRNVSWSEAAEACKALGKRLPTEVEWEYAATRHPVDTGAARLNTGGPKEPAAVGTHECTPDGICDLIGNVSEWTASAWVEDAGGSPDNGKRAFRGGSFNVSPKSRYALPTTRSKAPADTRDGEIGFRCARDREQ